MTRSPRPIFILSLPRSGSTLLQRVLSLSPEVSTAGEAWILLPLLYAGRRKGIRAEYGQVQTAMAMADLQTALRGGAEQYRERLRCFVEALYNDLSEPGTRYFVDKTPRYHLVAEELIEVFPDARFVFLWRNPLAVASSMLRTWAEDRWRLYPYRVDLLRGPSSLVRAWRSSGARGYQLRFEDLVQDPAATLPPLFRHLELDFDSSWLEELGANRVDGRLGDPTGAENYGEIDPAPVKKWKRTMKGPLRKWWCRRYLAEIGPEVLVSMGYEPEVIEDEIDCLSGRATSIVSDAVGMVRDEVRGRLDGFLHGDSTSGFVV